MTLWLVRAGKYGEDEATALEKGIAIVGWQELPDLSNIKSYEDMKKIHREYYPDAAEKSIISNSAQMWAFVGRITKGDIIALPLKTRSSVALGEVTGDYKHKDGRHTRAVKWKREDVQRSAFGQDLLFSLGTFSTICQIQRNDAEKRIIAIMQNKPDPSLSSGKSTNHKNETSEIIESENIMVDIEEQAFDQLRTVIQSRFKGHNLTRLVEAILNAQGYVTYRSPEGPDGGVDILAGSGAMGFEETRLCVQVKSGGVQSDAVVRELEGVMSRVNASRGLFVSWDGFKGSAIQKTKDLFFKVRLWDDKQLITALLENYHKLPAAMQAELPLKQVWVVVWEEE